MLVSLVGLPGVGKSTIGRRLARRLGVPFVDCDGRIEARLGETIAAYFARCGEQSFRDEESAVLTEALAAPGGVVSTGGGIVLREANRTQLRTRSCCIYLQAPHVVLLERIGRTDKRPLFRDADPAARLKELEVVRDPLYREAAHHVIATNGRDPQAMAEVLEAAIREWKALETTRRSTTAT